MDVMLAKLPGSADYPHSFMYFVVRLVDDDCGNCGTKATYDSVGTNQVIARLTSLYNSIKSVNRSTRKSLEQASLGTTLRIIVD